MVPAKTYELRITCDLARLWQKQGQTKEAQAILKTVYSWFRSGHDSIDLKEAQELLNELKK